MTDQLKVLRNKVLKIIQKSDQIDTYSDEQLKLYLCCLIPVIEIETPKSSKFDPKKMVKLLLGTEIKRISIEPTM